VNENRFIDNEKAINPLVNGKYQLLTNHKRNLGISALVFLLFPLFVVLFWSFTSGGIKYI
jgi:hypothetical protein